MILVEKHNININHPYYNELDKLCFLSKNLYNKVNYIVRQEFIESSKQKELGLVDNANYLNYYVINRMMIDNKDADFYQLPVKVSNQTLMLLDKNWKSFFKSIRDYKINPNKYNGRPKLPNYKDKNKGRFMLLYELGAISKTELKKYGNIKLSQTNINIPFIKLRQDKNIKLKCVRIIPKNNNIIIEIVYEKQEIILKENNNRYCSIDLGLNNLATIGSSIIKPIIINGKPLKSINQYYNKKLALCKSKLGYFINLKGEKQQFSSSNKIKRLANKRNNKINDYLHKSSRYVINHLVSNNINTLVIGKNINMKQDINIGKVNNQNFVQVSHVRFIEMLVYKAKLVGITIIINEESYTSKASFLDNDNIPIFNKKNNIDYIFSGKRIKRGLYISNKGKYINADLNGSLNILRKAVPNIEYDNGIEAIAVSPMVFTMK